MSPFINILLFGPGQVQISQWPLKAIYVELSFVLLQSIFCFSLLAQNLVFSDMTLQSLYTFRNDRFCTGAFLMCTQRQCSLKCAIQLVLTVQLYALMISFTIIFLLLKYKIRTLEGATLITNDDALDLSAVPFFCV